MPDHLQCTLLRSQSELEAFVPIWRELWRQDPDATPFQSPEWLLPWWHQFGGELRCVLLSRGGSVQGLLPFYLLVEPDSGERKMLPLGVGTSDYLDGVFAPGCSVEDVQAGLQVLGSDSGWDSFSVPQIRPESKLYRAFEIWKHPLRFESEACSRMPATLFSELPKKLRANVRYYTNRATRSGELRLTVAEKYEVDASFEAMVRLHTQRWQERGEPGVLSDPRVLAWHREALPLLSDAGMLRLSRLQFDGDVVAVAYSLLDPPHRPARTQYVYLTTYSTAQSEIRPGTLLLAMETERAANEGVHVIDMLRGEETYKQTIWHMEHVPTYGFSLQRESEAEENLAAMGAAA